MQEVLLNFNFKSKGIMHTIRFCKQNEYGLLSDFIRTAWKADHIFVTNKKLLDWQYLNEHEQRYNFVVAYNEEDKEFDAILGFIPISHFDHELAQYNELWLAIWRLKDSKKREVSGLNLLHFLKNKINPKSIYAIGITEEVKPIYRVLRYEIGKLTHFFIKNELKENPLIKLQDNKASQNNFDNNLMLKKEVKIKEINLLEYDLNPLIAKQNISPKKSPEYFINRYLKHKWYEYKFFGIFIDNILRNIFVARILENDVVKCIRIMDWIGSFPAEYLFNDFQKILKNHNVEYIDFLCAISDKTDLIKLGFSIKGEDDVIPEYFNPFVNENVDIFYGTKTSVNYMLVKGDSDQDRLNTV